MPPQQSAAVTVVQVVNCLRPQCMACRCRRASRRSGTIQQPPHLEKLEKAGSSVHLHRIGSCQQQRTLTAGSESQQPGRMKAPCTCQHHDALALETQPWCCLCPSRERERETERDGERERERHSIPLQNPGRTGRAWRTQPAACGRDSTTARPTAAILLHNRPGPNNRRSTRNGARLRPGSRCSSARRRVFKPQEDVLAPSGGSGQATLQRRGLIRNKQL